MMAEDASSEPLAIVCAGWSADASGNELANVPLQLELVDYDKLSGEELAKANLRGREKEGQNRFLCVFAGCRQDAKFRGPLGNHSTNDTVPSFTAFLATPAGTVSARSPS